MTRSSTTRITLGALAALILLPTAARGQDIGGSLGQLARDNGERFVAPVFEGLGFAMNSGFSDKAAVHEPLGFDVGIRVMGAFVPEARETFAPILPSSVTASFGGMQRTYSDPYAVEGGSGVTPTAVGAGQGARLVPTGQFASDLQAAGEDPSSSRWALRFPDGLDIPAIPFVVLQGSLGVGFNTELSLRAIPAVTPSEDVGEVQAFGIGGKHMISGWFPGPFPLDVSVSAGYQDFQVGDYLDASSTSFGLLVGKGFGPLDLYAVGRNVSPSVDVGYPVENPEGNPALPDDGTRISFSPAFDSETRFGLGANLTLMVVNITGEYTFGDYNVASVKAGISFR